MGREGEESERRTRSNDIEHVHIMLRDQPIQMSVYKHKTWTRSPVSQKPRLDIVLAQLILKQDVIVQEDHSFTRSRAKGQRAQVGIQMQAGIRLKWQVA